MKGEYTFKQNGFEVTDQMKHDFNENGYIIVRGILDNEELAVLRKALEHSNGVTKHAHELDDGHGRKIKMCSWFNNPGHDVTGMASRCEKIVNTFEQLLGGPIYHFHTKLVMKDAGEGGAFQWHQDYGYWYKGGFLFPDMGTVFTAIDKADQSNGCLQVLKGSHKCGRIDHTLIGSQLGAEIQRVQQLEKCLELVHVEMQPGDALFFHSNLLHCSSVNNSQFRRWAFLIAYNRVSNIPVEDVYKSVFGLDSHFTPLQKVPDTAIRECSNFTDMTDKDFLNASKTVKYQEENAKP